MFCVRKPPTGWCTLTITAEEERLLQIRHRPHRVIRHSAGRRVRVWLPVSRLRTVDCPPVMTVSGGERRRSSLQWNDRLVPARRCCLLPRPDPRGEFGVSTRWNEPRPRRWPAIGGVRHAGASLVAADRDRSSQTGLVGPVPVPTSRGPPTQRRARATSGILQSGTLGW
jgi:hypothetical protein